MLRRPYWLEFFYAFMKEPEQEVRSPPISTHELGTEQGFLSERLLKAIGFAEYVALDFSSAMHALAAERLGKHAKVC